MSTFRLPDLGEGLAEAEILEWHVKPGDHVLVDQPMVSVETAKAVVEVPVPFSGIVTALHGAVGDIVATGAPLIDFDSGTVVGSMPVTSDGGIRRVGKLRTAARQRRGPQPRGAGGARARASRLDSISTSIEGSGPAGLIKLDDVAQRMAAAPHPARRHQHAGGVRRRTQPDVPAGAAAEPLRGARRAMAHSMSLSRDQFR